MHRYVPVAVRCLFTYCGTMCAGFVCLDGHGLGLRRTLQPHVGMYSAQLEAWLRMQAALCRAGCTTTQAQPGGPEEPFQDLAVLFSQSLTTQHGLGDAVLSILGFYVGLCFHCCRQHDVPAESPGLGVMGLGHSFARNSITYCVCITYCCRVHIVSCL